MFGLFKKKTKGFTLSLLELPCDGFCAVAGESHYQEALRATEGICSGSFEGRPSFMAALVAEPDNPYDKNAIAVYSPAGKLGYLPREMAREYRGLFAEISSRGYQGGACDAHLTGGGPGKFFGGVLRVSDPYTCLDGLDASDTGTGVNRARGAPADLLETYLDREASPDPGKIGIVFSTIGRRDVLKAVDVHRGVVKGATAKELLARCRWRNLIAHTGDRKGHGRAVLTIGEFETFRRQAREIVEALEPTL